MKKLLLFLLLMSPVVAQAADIPVKAPPAVVVPTSGSGLYFGVLGAGAKTNAAFDFLTVPGTGNVRPSGLMAGGLVGFGMWNASAMIAVEADGSYDFTKSNVPCALITACEVKNSFLLTQRLVIGASLSSLTGAARQAGVAAPLQWPTTLNVPTTLGAATLIPYVTGGIAERRIKACVDLEGCGQEWLIGWTAGAGVRMPVSASFSVDLSYLYINWNKHFIPASMTTIFPVDFHATTEHLLRVALIGHF